jgi:hypothetical protein
MPDNSLEIHFPSHFRSRQSSSGGPRQTCKTSEHKVRRDMHSSWKDYFQYEQILLQYEKARVETEWDKGHNT